MDQVLQPVINKCALVYLDDIIIASNSVEEHIEHLASLLQQAGLSVKLEKY